MREGITHVVERMALDWALKDLYSGPGGAHGNVSCRIDKHNFLIKPSGVKNPNIDQLCLIRIVAYGGGMLPTISVTEGELNPSVDTAHHAQIYIENEWVKAICHTHSDYVVAHALANRPIECASTEQADIFGGRINCAPYADLDSWSLDLDLDEKGVQALLLGHHGGLTFAKDPQKAVELAKRMEDVARKNYLASQIHYPGYLHSMPEKEIKKWRKRYLKGYGQKK